MLISGKHDAVFLWRNYQLDPHHVDGERLHCCCRVADQMGYVLSCSVYRPFFRLWGTKVAVVMAAEAFIHRICGCCGFYD